MARVRRGEAHFWRCTCGAHALTDSALRRIVQPEVWTKIWPTLRTAAEPSPYPCPACHEAMERTSPLEKAGNIRADICDKCRLVFLDPNELAAIPKVPVPEDHTLPKKQREAIARALVMVQNAEYDGKTEALFAPLEELGQVLLATITSVFLRSY